MLLVLLGAPGAGKGTQAEALTEKVGVAHVSSGDLLRKHRAEKTELGTQAQSFMDKGDLVPDDLVIKMVLGRLAEETNGAGVVLDGFPRTEPQAVALDAALEGKGIDRVLYVKVPEDELVRRLGGRFNCRSCQRPAPEEAAYLSQWQVSQRPERGEKPPISWPPRAKFAHFSRADAFRRVPGGSDPAHRAARSLAATDSTVGNRCRA